jgi:hypothetical protein
LASLFLNQRKCESSTKSEEDLDGEEVVQCETDDLGVKADLGWSSARRGDPARPASLMLTFYRWKAKYAGLETESICQPSRTYEGH